MKSPVKEPANENQIESIDTEELQKPKDWGAKRASDLYTVDSFLSIIEQTYLHLNYPKFEHDKLTELLLAAKNSSADETDEEIRTRDEETKAELNKWRKSLEKRNERLETYHMRRYCDTSDEPVSYFVLGTLIKFYRKLPYSSANQSKFDLFLTRLSSEGTDQMVREVRYSRPGLTKKLGVLFGELTVNDQPTEEFSEEYAEAIEEFDAFIAEADSYDDFEDIARYDLFERLRSHKRDIREIIYDPNVAAAAVFCNIAVGNAFLRLLSQASPPLNDMFAGDIDLAAALSDASDEIRSHINETVSEIRIKVDESRDDQLSHFFEMLEIICKDEDGTDKKFESVSQDKSDLGDPESILASGEKRVAPLLKTIVEAEPDRKLLREHMVEVESLESIDLNDFIVPQDDETSSLCRSVLIVIILAEEIRTRELAKHDSISPKIQNELRGILQRSQQFAEELEEHIEDSELPEKMRLQAVASKLLETGLKLKRDIVKLSERYVEKSLEELAAVESRSIGRETRSGYFPSYIETSSDEPTSRWLIAATVFLTFASFIYYFYNWEPPLREPESPFVEKMDPKGLPNGKHLIVGYKQDSLLFVTAKDSWKELSEEERQKNLEELFAIDTDPRIKNVVLTDGKGEFLGNISKEGVTFGGQPDIAENDGD